MKPFIKWAGGKTQLLPEIIKRLPDMKQVDLYGEPFVGGGAVLANIPLGKNCIAYLGDNCSDLITTYQVIADDTQYQSLIELLQTYKTAHSKEFYLKTRATNFKSKEQIASRFIYLNKTCFNGLYRVNKSGQFNVPLGDYARPKILDADVLLEWRRFLKRQHCIFLNDDFEVFTHKLAAPHTRAFFYCDPPYDGTFTGYTPGGFTSEDQARLCKILKDMSKYSNFKFMLSNNNTDYIRYLYADYNIEVVKARRNINSDGKGRGKVEEVLIRNYA